MGGLGSALILGMMAGLIGLDLTAWYRGQGFSGQSLVAGAVLGVMALAPGLACWVAGRRMMRDRLDPTPRAPLASAGRVAAAFFLGALLGWFLGLPTP